MLSKKSPITEVPIPAKPSITPRLLRITDAAHYLSATYTFVETLIREKAIPSVVVGKRHVIDVRDLDAYIENLKDEQSAA